MDNPVDKKRGLKIRKKYIYYTITNKKILFLIKKVLTVKNNSDIR